VTNNEIRFNHGVGVVMGRDWVVAASRAQAIASHHNGQEGYLAGAVHSAGTGNLTFSYNEVDHNNTCGYDPFWEAGGGKTLGCNGSTFRFNYSHDNNGPGFWWDWGNFNTVCTDNTSADNLIGIEYEISYGPASFLRNTVRFPNGSWGHGIFMMTSDGAPGAIEVAYNQITDAPGTNEWGNYSDLPSAVAVWQQNRGEAARSPDGGRLNIHDNVYTGAAMCQSWFTDYDPNGTFMATRTRSQTIRTMSAKWVPSVFWSNTFLTLADFQISYPGKESGSTVDVATDLPWRNWLAAPNDFTGAALRRLGRRRRHDGRLRQCHGSGRLHDCRHDLAGDGAAGSHSISQSFFASYSTASAVCTSEARSMQSVHLYVTTRDGVVHRETNHFRRHVAIHQDARLPRERWRPWGLVFRHQRGADGAANLPAVTFAAWGAQLNEGATLDD